MEGIVTTPHRVLYPLIVLSMAIVMAISDHTIILVGAGLVTAGAVAALVVKEWGHRQGGGPAS